MGVIIIIFGGGGGGLLLLLVLAIVVAAAIGTGAMAAFIAALTIFLYWVAGVMAGAAVLGGAAWFLTRGHRAHKRALEAAEIDRRQLEYAERREIRRQEREHIAALTQARAMAPVAAMIAEAIRQGNQPYPEPPPTYHYSAEVIRDED